MVLKLWHNKLKQQVKMTREKLTYSYATILCIILSILARLSLAHDNANSQEKEGLFNR